MLEGDFRRDGRPGHGFTRLRFATDTACLLRSGYPVLLAGDLVGHGPHAVVLTGFRPTASRPVQTGEALADEEEIGHFYVHDDNTGPSVRLKLTELADGVELTPDPPEGSGAIAPNVAFRPRQALAAVDEGLRLSPDDLNHWALAQGRRLSAVLAEASEGDPPGFTVTTRFFRAWEYADGGLADVLPEGPDLGRVRLALWERVEPMSLHVGVVRFATSQRVAMDVLVDTTSCGRGIHAFCHVVYWDVLESVLDWLEGLTDAPSLGQRLSAT